MRVALFALVAWLAVVPSARASFINFEVLEGYVKRTGYGTGELFLSGMGFEVHVLAGSSGGGCRGYPAVGRPIVPCDPYYYIGGLGSLIWNGVETPIGFDAQFNVIANPMFVSGVTHAVLTTPATYAGSIFGCEFGAAACFSGFSNMYGFNVQGMSGLWSVELQLTEGGLDYEILEETYTFHRVPESSSLALAAIGLVGFLGYRRFGGLST